MTFDGSGSSDDRQPPEDLTYQWDYTNNGSIDATGQVATHTYATPGTYTARLVVTDGGNLSDEDLLQVVVLGSTAPDLRALRTIFENRSTPDGRRIRVMVKIKNAGDASAGPSDTHFTHHSDFIGLTATPSIPAGGFVWVRSPLWDARGLRGVHRVTITADYNEVIGESNEQNNVKIRGYEIRNGWAV